LVGQEKIATIYCNSPYNIEFDYDKGIGGKARYGGKTNDKKSDSDYKEFKKIIQNSLAASKHDCPVFYFCDEGYI
jgi:hypothetical protein